MFRNEKELLNSLFGRLKEVKEEIKPTPLTKEEKAEIESYRDSDGLIDLTGVKCFNELKRLVELVDRKNHIEELTIKDNDSIQSFVGDLVTELLPFLGIDKASVNVNTPAGKASVEVEQGKEPKVTYDFSEKTDDTKLTYTVTPTETTVDEPTIDEICAVNECGTCPQIENCIKDVRNLGLISPLDVPVYGEDVKTVCSTNECAESDNVVVDLTHNVVLDPVGGDYNPAFYNAVLHICETEYFDESDVYRFDEELPEKVHLWVLLPNAFGKISETYINEYIEYMDNGASVSIMDPETFELTGITNPFDLYEYAMTEAQEEALRR